MMRDKAEELRRKDEGPLYITPEGLQRLKEKLARLQESQPALADEAQKAAAYGDRSENFEYKEAKKNLRSTRNQILTLQYQIKTAVVIKPGTQGGGFIEIGSTVTLEEVGNPSNASGQAPSNTSGQEKKTFQVLGSHETSPAKGRISYKSPLGVALMNHVEGETITFQTPGGVRKYKILEVR